MTLRTLLCTCLVVGSSKKFRPNHRNFKITFEVPELPNESELPLHSHCSVLEASWTQQGSRLAKIGKPHVQISPSIRQDAHNAPCMTQHVKGSRVNRPCPKTQKHHHFDRRTTYQLYATTKIGAYAALRKHCRKHTGQVINATAVLGESFRDDAEIKLLRSTGEPSNRIDVVLMGDGYTASERDLFFEDMERLTQDMFTQETFASFLPVFNIWAIYLPSGESGIGVMSTPRDTAFRLYRDGTELRGIFTDNHQGAIEACRLTGADACDFPSLIGNDDFYGGLGGTFVIGTKSITTGTKVLRHEMGHNFANVGEGYDGGSVYRGVNSAPSVSQIPDNWKAWLSAPNKVAAEERSQIRLEEYPWYDLAEGPIEFTFQSDGDFRRWMLRFTASGCDEQGSLLAFLDGQPLALEAPGYLDRAFYTLKESNKGFATGSHTLRFEQGMPPAAGGPIRQLCSLVMHEYMEEGPGGFHFNNSYVSAYPTWDIRGTQRVRPMNEYDLMRNMSSKRFGPVMIEGTWMQFLAKVGLIDDVDVESAGSPSRTTVAVHTLPLGAARATLRRAAGDHKGNFEHLNGYERHSPEQIAFYGRFVREELQVAWYKRGSRGSYERQAQYDGMTTFDAGETSSAAGSWRVVVKFITDEIRTDPNGLTESTLDFVI